MQVKMKARGTKGKSLYWYYVFCLAAGVVALLPVSCSYIMNSGIITEWIARVEELAVGFEMGQSFLFPSAEVILGTGIKANAMNSNLWFALPGFLVRLTGNMVTAYRIYMLVLQIGTLLASILFFERIFAGAETRLPAFFGVLLYMTCPYRLYVCYDLANISQTVAWMLLPLYLWAVMGILGVGAGKGFGSLHFTVVAACALAGIGYADAVFFVTAAGLSVLTGALAKKWQLLAAVAAGSAAFLPGLQHLFQYMFLGGFQELDLPLQSIMGNGYSVGEYFGAYSFRNEHPGMGLGMLACLLTGGWLWFVEKSREPHRVCRNFARLSLFLTVLSLCLFPWDLCQRLGGWALRLVALAGTPAVFWGMGFLCLCVPAACAMERISRHEDRRIAFVVPLIVLLACLGICVYQCNTLIYSRPPLQ